MQTVTPYEHAKSWLKPATQMSTRQAFWSGMKAGADGNMLGLPFVAYEMGTAQRGEMLATATGRVTGLCTYPVTAGLTLAMLSAIPGVNVVAYPIVAAILAQFPNSYLENKIISGIRTLNQAGRRIRRLEVGGDFEDSESASAARQRSLRELTGTMQTSRRYLGQEALFMHR
jgi:hypothetical protein